MFSVRKLFHALLGASLITTVLAVATTAQADTPLPGNKPCSTVAPQAGATKVLLAGDSIVHESRGDYTWRYFLYKQLVAAGVNTDFVGDYNWVVDGNKSDWPYCDYNDPNFDTDFTASPGVWLADYNLSNSSTGNLPWARYEVQTHQADVLVMLAGANDLAGKPSRQAASPQATVTAAQQIVTNARAANPNLKIVFVTVPTATGNIKYAEPQFAAYNQQLAAAIPTWSTVQSPIKVADVMHDWGTATYTWDQIHPNVVGEQLIAKGIADQLNSLGIGLPGLPVNPDFKNGIRKPVTDFTATLNGSKVDMTWTLPIGASGVQVMARDTTGGAVGDWFVAKDLTWYPADFFGLGGCKESQPCTSYSLTTLSPGHSYDVDLHSEKGFSVATDLWARSTAQPGVETSGRTSVTIPGDFTPSAPAISTATAGIRQVTVSWSAVPGAETYRVGWRIGTGSWTFSSASAATSRLVKPLNAGIKYDFRVQAITGTKASGWSASKFAIPKAYVMATPAKPILKLLAGQKVRVTWKRITGANRYLLQFHQVGGAWRNIAFYTGTTYTSGKLLKKKAYEWRVVAYDGVVAGKTSLAARITIK